MMLQRLLVRAVEARSLVLMTRQPSLKYQGIAMAHQLNRNRKDDWNQQDHADTKNH